MTIYVSEAPDDIPGLYSLLLLPTAAQIGMSEDDRDRYILTSASWLLSQGHSVLIPAPNVPKKTVIQEHVVDGQVVAEEVEVDDEDVRTAKTQALKNLAQTLNATLQIN